MGIFDRLRTAARLPDLVAARPAVASPWADTSHLNQVVWPDILGMGHNLPITRTEAMTVPAIARARNLICGSIARLPMTAYAKDVPLATQPGWLDSTAGPVSPFHRMLWTVDDLLFSGWSLWAVTRDGSGHVTAGARVLIDRWSFDEAGVGVLLDGEPVTTADVLLIPGFHEGILQYGEVAIRHAVNVNRAAGKAAETPSANLELHQTNDAPMTDVDIKTLIASWAAARRGENGGVAYTNSAIELKEHGAYQEHLLIEGRNAAAVDIARVAGVPAALIDASSSQASLSYQTVEGRNAEFVDYGLAPMLSAISARLGMDDVVPSGVSMRFDLESFIGPAPHVVAPDDRQNPPAGGPTSPASPPAGVSTDRKATA